MAESSDQFREERRIRQFKGELMHQISIMRAPYPDRNAVDNSLKKLANDVVLIGYYGDKLNYAGMELHDICKEYSNTLKALGHEYASCVATTRGHVLADTLEKMMIEMPF